MDIHPEQLAPFDVASTSGPPDAGAVGAGLRDLTERLDPRRMARLTLAELATIALRYGGPPRSLADTGLALGGLPRERVRELERNAIRALSRDAREAA